MRRFHVPHVRTIAKANAQILVSVITFAKKLSIPFDDDIAIIEHFDVTILQGLYRLVGGIFEVKFGSVHGFQAEECIGRFVGRGELFLHGESQGIGIIIIIDSLVDRQVPFGGLGLQHDAPFRTSTHPPRGDRTWFGTTEGHLPLPVISQHVSFIVRMERDTSVAVFDQSPMRRGTVPGVRIDEGQRGGWWCRVVGRCQWYDGLTFHDV
eukprot:scaffold2880_cov173-Amphora_coffeaeformis.AAC.2